MTRWPRLHGNCPVCGAGGLSFGTLRCVNRVCRATCRSCGQQLISEIGMRLYFLLAMYMQVLVMVLALPFIGGLLMGGWKGWVLAGSALAVFVALVWPPAMALHARPRSLSVYDRLTAPLR